MSLKNKTQPINIPKKNFKNTILHNYDNYIYKSPNTNYVDKSDKELIIENFIYMNDNFDPNNPPKKSPPISKSFKRRYLEILANKIMIN